MNFGPTPKSDDGRAMKSLATVIERGAPIGRFIWIHARQRQLHRQRCRTDGRGKTVPFHSRDISPTLLGKFARVLGMPVEHFIGSCDLRFANACGLRGATETWAARIHSAQCGSDAGSACAGGARHSMASRTPKETLEMAMTPEFDEYRLGM